MSELTSIEQKRIVFNDSEITAVLCVDPSQESKIYVPLRPLIEGLGLSWSSQRKRINRDPILAEAMRSVVVMTTDRGEREMLSLPLDLLDGFLFKINANRVKPELRDSVIAYQKYCYRVLAGAFREPSALMRYYQSIGQSPSWISARIQAFETNYALSKTWDEIGLSDSEQAELASLLDLTTFGMNSEAYKQLKGLEPDDDLHDNMTRVELLFDMLADEGAIREGGSDFDSAKQGAVSGGTVSKQARLLFEAQFGSVMTADNKLDEINKRPFLADDLEEEE